MPAEAEPSEVDSAAASSETQSAQSMAAESNASRPIVSEFSVAAKDAAGMGTRLHKATLWVPALESATGAIVPIIIGSFFVGPVAPLFFGMFVLIPVVLYHAFQYVTLTYQVGEDELVIRSGYLSRRERRIPLDRIQEVEIRQSIVPRLFGLARVNLSTAGSDSQEASLNVLTKVEADQLKQKIADGVRGSTMSSASEEFRQAGANEYDFRFDLNLKTLLIGGVTSKVVATLGAIIGSIAYFHFFVGVGDRWFSKFTDPIEEKVGDNVPGAELLEQFEPDVPVNGFVRFVYDLWMVDTFPKSVLLAGLGLAAAIIAYVVRFYGFRLHRTGDVMSTSYGLLNFRQGSLGRDRIQALKLEETFLRRWFSLADVRVDSAGDRSQVDENKNRDVLVPVANLADAEEVARQAIPGLQDLQPSWNRISPLAIMRGSKKGWLLAATAMLQLYFMAGWYCLTLLPAFPLIYLLNRKWYQHTGYWSCKEYLLVRKGWINRSTICIPVRNIQSVTMNQNWFDRRLNLATVFVDIAGQSNTGGGPRIRHLPIELAERLRRTLCDQAARCEFRW